MKTILTCVLFFLGAQAVAQPHYSLVFLHKKPDADSIGKEAVQRLMEGHMANMQRLAKEDKLLAAGPFDGGGGLFIMNSSNKQEVEGWIATDPGIQARRWNIEIVPYVPLYGGVCPVGEDYEMTSYTFIRFTPIAAKFNVSRYSEIMKRHHDYLKDLRSQGNVITEATFGKDEGGILILKGDVDDALFQADPGVLEGLITGERKSLYIARGSFCEKN